MRRLVIATWMAFVLIVVGLGLLIADIYGDSEQMRIERALSNLGAACQSINAAYSAGVSLSDLERRDGAGRSQLLDDIVARALKPIPGVEGGIWSSERGFVGYAYPSYSGTTPKTDVPEAEIALIQSAAAQAVKLQGLATTKRDEERETVLVGACVLPSPPSGVAAWSLTRVHRNGPAYNHLLAAAIALLAFSTLAGAALTIAFRRRAERLSRLEHDLSHYAVDNPAPLPLSADAELDRIVRAVNALGARLAAAQSETRRLHGLVARSERLTAIGRMSATLAHEIRNPLGAMRLKAENALAANTYESLGNANAFVLTQIARLETLVKHMLSMTKTVSLRRERVPVEEWIHQHVAALKPQAEIKRVSVHPTGGGFAVDIDPDELGRALDNILDNAIRHAPEGSSVRVAAERDGAVWRLTVSDEGPGVADSVKGSLFEPFVTTRPDGTGLGLAIAFDIVGAHAGTLRALPATRGATFQMELPWPGS